MEILLKIIGTAFIVMTAYQLLKNTHSSFGPLLLIAGGAVILYLLSDTIVSVMTTITSLGEKSGMPTSILTTLLKIVGIGYLTEYSVSVCSDCDCASLGKKIEIGGKLVILATSLPIITQIVDMIGALL